MTEQLLDYTELYAFTGVYKEKLGLTYGNYAYFEQEEELELIGFVKNGDTTGVVYSDSYMMDIDELRNLVHKPEIYPNPSNGLLIISFDTPEATVSIFSINGKLIDEFKANTNEMYHYPDLAPGIYLVKVETDRMEHHLKWVKQ
jgi:hypothetical protein